MEAPSLFIALLAGLFSFLSPCVLPLVPAYIGYMSGSALAVARGNTNSAQAGGTTATATMSTVSARWAVMGHALLFVAGLTLVFVVVIGGMAGAFSYLLKGNIKILQQIMGVMLLVFGLHMIGAINIPFLNYTRRMELRPPSNMGYLRSFLIGLGFGIGWTPCVGPTLGAILTLSINGRTDQAFLPALAYSLGLGIPFLLTALAMGRVSSWLKKITRRSYTFKIGSWTAIDQVNIISLLSGLLLIMMGVLIFTNALTLLTALVPNFGI